MADIVKLNFTDEEGEKGSTSHWASDLSGDWVTTYTPLWDAFQGVSAASQGRIAGTRVNTYLGATTASVYPNIEDRAVFEFTDAAGNTNLYSVPAPKDTIFLADDETIDSADLDVAELITQIIALAVSKAGDAIVAYLRGFRERLKTRK